MFVMAAEFVGALKAARMFASTDETRMHMCCVHVEATGSALRIVATDGHTLWCCEVPARDSAADPPPAYQKSWNLRLADVDAIAKTLKDALEIEVLLPKHEIAGVVYPSASEDFTRYKAVLPQAITAVASKPGKAIPEFASSYIARACEALAHYGRGFAPTVPAKGTKWEKQRAREERNQCIDPPVAWRTGAELDPALVYSPKFPSAFALVMPRRGEGSSAVPVQDFIDRVCSDAKTKAA
jgi:hypothetical protein